MVVHWAPRLRTKPKQGTKSTAWAVHNQLEKGSSTLASTQAQLGSQSHLAPSPTPSTFRANPYPEVKDPICRFPLPTFIYRLEAVHLGDLMRLSVRSGGRSRRGPHHGFQGPTRMHGRRSSATLFGRLTLSLRGGIPGFVSPLHRKENSSRHSRQLPMANSRCRDGYEDPNVTPTRFPNKNGIPFRPCHEPHALRSTHCVSFVQRSSCATISGWA